ncbi:MAG: DUF6988 family protein [Lysobacter sp.]
MTKLKIDLANGLSMQRGLNLVCRNAFPRLPLVTKRSYFTSAAFILAIDFHEAISNNLESGSHAVAAALLRPIWECGIAAAWVLYRADEEQLLRLYANPLDLEHLWIDEADLPTPTRMLKQLKETGLVEEYARNHEALMEGNGKFFHKYTHVTVFQLKRTFVTSDTPTGFSDADQMAILTLADTLLLACAAVFQAQTQDQDLNLYIQYRFERLRSDVPNLNAQLPQWKPLPDPREAIVADEPPDRA